MDGGIQTEASGFDSDLATVAELDGGG